MNKVYKSNYLKKIKNKKVSTRASDVFSSLNAPIEKQIKKLPASRLYLVTYVSPELKRAAHKKRKLDFLDGLYKKGLPFTPKQLRRYVRLLGIFNREVPKDIKESHEKVIPKKKESKRKRVPNKYDTYIKSKYWTARKNLFYQKFGRKCFKCGSSNKMSLHHLRYDNNLFGYEPDEDLVGLCWSCHEKFHQLYGVTKDSKEDFKLFMLN